MLLLLGDTYLAIPERHSSPFAAYRPCSRTGNAAYADAGCNVELSSQAADRTPRLEWSYIRATARSVWSLCMDWPPEPTARCSFRLSSWRVCWSYSCWHPYGKARPSSTLLRCNEPAESSGDDGWLFGFAVAQNRTPFVRLTGWQLSRVGSAASSKHSAITAAISILFINSV